MHALKTFLIVLFFILMGSACTIPAKKVSTGVVMPRGVMMDAQSFNDGESFEKFQGSFGFGKGESFADDGVVQFGNYFNGSFEYLPAKSWALGIRPYYGVSDRELTDRNHMGLELYQRVRMVNSRPWRIFLFNSFRFAENLDSDSDVFCFIFCASTGNQASFASVKAFEISVIPIIEVFLSKKNSIALTPELIFRSVETENRHTLYGAYQHKQSRFDYSLGAYYGMRFGQNDHTLLQLGGGYKKRHGFGNATENKDGFNIDLQLRFAFGSKEKIIEEDEG